MLHIYRTCWAWLRSFRSFGDISFRSTPFPILYDFIAFWYSSTVNEPSVGQRKTVLVCLLLSGNWTVQVFVRSSVDLPSIYPAEAHLLFDDDPIFSVRSMRSNSFRQPLIGGVLCFLRCLDWFICLDESLVVCCLIFIFLALPTLNLFLSSTWFGTWKLGVILVVKCYHQILSNVENSFSTFVIQECWVSPFLFVEPCMSYRNASLPILTLKLPSINMKLCAGKISTHINLCSHLSCWC